MSEAAPSRDRLRALTTELMLIPCLSGHEGRVRRRLGAGMLALGLSSTTDRLGNLIATADLEALAGLVVPGISRIKPGFRLNRDDYEWRAPISGSTSAPTSRRARPQSTAKGERRRASRVRISSLCRAPGGRSIARTRTGGRFRLADEKAYRRERPCALRD